MRKNLPNPINCKYCNKSIKFVIIDNNNNSRCPKCSAILDLSKLLQYISPCPEFKIPLRPHIRDISKILPSLTKQIKPSPKSRKK